VVVKIAALAPWKGHELFLDAAAEVHRTDPTIRFAAVGSELYVTDGHEGYGDVLRQRARALGLGSVFAFPGHRHDVADIMRAADVIAHVPIEPEPFGRVVAEAMACGRPVIAACEGGVAEIAGTDGGVVAVAPRDAKALAEAVLSVLGDPAASARAMRGRCRITGHFSAEAHTDRIQSVYAFLVTRAPLRGHAAVSSTR
jgi:glycosyltransferase involved in cell wall biosynthesis